MFRFLERKGTSTSTCYLAHAAFVGGRMRFSRNSDLHFGQVSSTND